MDSDLDGFRIDNQLDFNLDFEEINHFSYDRPSKTQVSIEKDDFKKARKQVIFYSALLLFRRQQNRESAFRSRLKKKEYVTQLEQKLAGAGIENSKLFIENMQLKTENSLLKQQLEFCRGVITHGNVTVTSQGLTASQTLPYYTSPNEKQIRGKQFNKQQAVMVLTIICMICGLQFISNESDQQSYRRLLEVHETGQSRIGVLIVLLVILFSSFIYSRKSVK